MNRATISKIYIYYTGVESVTRLSFLFFFFFPLLLYYTRKFYIFTKEEEGGRERGGYMKKLFLSDAFHHRRDVRRTTSIHWDTSVRAIDVSHCRTNPDYKFQPRCCNLWIRLTDWSTDCKSSNYHKYFHSSNSTSGNKYCGLAKKLRFTKQSSTENPLATFVRIVNNDNTRQYFYSLSIFSRPLLHSFTDALQSLFLSFSLSLSLFLRNISIASFVPFVS